MNSEELREQWQRVTERIVEYDSVDSSQVNAFFSRLVPQAMSDGFLMLTADNDFIKSWVESHYLSHIQRALRDLNHIDYAVAIEVDENQQAPSQQAATQRSTATSQTTTNPQPSAADEHAEQPSAAQAFQAADPSEQEAAHVPTLQESQPDNAHDRSPVASESSVPFMPQEPTSLRTDIIADDLLAPTSSLTFENFVIGESNRMAYSMAVAVAEEPGRQMLNPLFIYGKSGLGKTHLMRAIQNYVAETRPELRTIYVDSADFLTGYVEATLAHDKEKTSFKNFKSHYQDANILLIDDIQYLQGKEQTLDIVFQIFNHMVGEGKQIVLSADRAPKNITMDERYQSRFNSGGTFDIQPPSVETKMGIIKSFIGEYRISSDRPDFELPEDVSRYIAENSGSNIRELKSAVTKIIYAINAFGADDMTIDRMSRLLENHFSGGAMKKLSIPDIQKQVEQYYGVPHSDLIGQRRDRRIMHARKIAVYLSREMLDLPYNYIGKSFGGRDHTTIMHSVTSVEMQMNESREMREEIENIKRRIKDM